MLTDNLGRAQDSFGQTVTDNPQRNKSWWCKTTLDPIVEIQNRARQWFILTKSPKSKECYRQWNQHFRETIKTLKRNAWLRFLENSSNDSLWKALTVTKRSTTKSILPLCCPDGTLTSDKPVQAELLFRGTSCIAAPIDLADVPDRPDSRLVCYPQVTTEEIADCIEKIAPKKAPGVDGIANELLKISSPSLSPLLVPIFNQSLATSSFPTPWKCAVTAIIPKAGKDDYTDPNSYRPIALLSGLGKIFELMITQRITAWAEKNNILADGHLGGRKGEGTEDALVLLDTWVQKKWQEKKYVSGLFLDVKSAYPSVHPKQLIHYLCSLGCPAYLVVIIESFLENRQTTIRMANYTSDPFDIAIGLPQGSPLSVILYIIYNNSLLTKECSLERDSISIGYIDDVVHLAAAATTHATTSLLSSLGTHSLEWGSRFGAIFDKKKAQFMWLTRRVHPLDTFPFGDQTLKVCDSVKWLGAVIDKKLTYTAMFSHLEQKATKTISQFKQLGNSRWGLKEKDWVRLMESVLMPRVSYGTPIWATHQNKSKLRNLADKVDNLAALFTLGTFKSTPISWHRSRSAVREAASTFITTSFKFFTQKLTVKCLNNRLEPILITRGFLKPDWAIKNLPIAQEQLTHLYQAHPETVHIQYKKRSDHPRANY
jgi:hypothetical protein